METIVMYVSYGCTMCHLPLMVSHAIRGKVAQSKLHDLK